MTRQSSWLLNPAKIISPDAFAHPPAKRVILLASTFDSCIIPAACLRQPLECNGAGQAQVDLISPAGLFATVRGLW